MSTQAKTIEIGSLLNRTNPTEAPGRKDIVPYAERSGTSDSSGYYMPEDYATIVNDGTSGFRGMIIDAWSIQIPKEAYEKIKTTDSTGGTSGTKLSEYISVEITKGATVEPYSLADLITTGASGLLNGDGRPTLTGTDSVSYPEWPTSGITPLLDTEDPLYNPWQAVAECYDEFYTDITSYGGSKIPCDQLALLIQKLYDELYKLSQAVPYDTTNSPFYPTGGEGVFGNATAFESKYGNLYIGGFNKTPVKWEAGAVSLDDGVSSVTGFDYISAGPIESSKVNYLKLSVSDEILAVLNTALGTNGEGTNGYTLSNIGYKPLIDKVNTGNVVIWCGPCDPRKHKHIKYQEDAMDNALMPETATASEPAGIRMSPSPSN